jgi:O-antigen/teichoic acid export membrane protein
LLSKYRTIIGQGAWVLAGQAATGALSLAGNRLITQFLSPELYGAVNLLQGSLVLLRTLFCSPMLNAALRFYPNAEGGNFVPALRQLLRRSLGKSTISMGVITIVGGLIWTSISDERALIVPILVAYVALDVMRTLETTLLNAAREQRSNAILSVSEALIKPLLVVGFVLTFGTRIETVMGAFATAILVTLILFFSAIRSRPSGGEATLPPTLAGQMWRYAIPLIPIALLTWTSSLSDRYIIELLSGDIASVGVYAAGYGLISQPFLLIHGVVALTLRPVYFAAVSRADEERAQRILLVWLATTTLICSSAVVLIYVLRFILVKIFLGPRYFGAVEFVPWIALGYFFYVIEQVLEQWLLAHNRTNLVLLAQTCGAVASLIVTVPLVLRFGALGAAYACPAYFLIQAGVAAALIKKSIK